MTRKTVALAFAATLLAATSCLPTAGTQRPDWAAGNPRADDSDLAKLARWFETCHLSSSAAPRTRAFGAAVLSLHERAWVVTRAEIGRGLLGARKCYRDEGLCAEVDFEAAAAGSLYVNPRRCSPGIGDDLRRWLLELEETYAKYRCYTDDALRDEMNKVGISL